MILRKENIVVVAVSASVAILVILIIIGILGLATDVFKSNETLFAKYFVQNFNIIEILKNEDVLGIEKMLNENKYISDFGAKVEYTENIGTSAENKNSAINNIILAVKSNIDNANDYAYRDVSVRKEDEDLVKFELINEGQNYGLRLNGIQQYVSADASTDQEILKSVKLENIESLTSKIDINPILNFSEEEKQTLMETYIKLIQGRISKDQYYKQSKTLITLNNEDIQTNSYYIKMTVEEYNNLLVDILSQISRDEIILSRIDVIEDIVKEKYVDYQSDESLRTQFTNAIENKINEILDNNIGSDEVRITVYERNDKTVRTSVEKNADKIIIDLYGASSVSFDRTELGEIERKTFIKLEKDETNNIFMEYGVVENNTTIRYFRCDYQQTLEGSEINKTIDIELSNQKYKCILSMADNIIIVEDFSDKKTLDRDNIVLRDLGDEQLEMVMGIVLDNVEKQLTNLESQVSIDDCIKMLQNLGYLDESASLQLPSEGEVSELEKKRFNSQFEFFVSENLTTDNIKELIDVAENSFEDMKVLFKTGEIQELDMEKMNSPRENGEYFNDISEILIFIKSNTSNEQEKDDTINLLEYDSSDKYSVLLQYDENGLVRLVRIQIQDEQ